ncbi:MAG: hypothetical protein ACE5G0_05515 [Rhodothermales bacterium]
MRWTIVGKRLVFLAALNIGIIIPARGQRKAVEQAWQRGQQALEAYEAGEYTAYLQHLRQALALRPNHPGLTYRVAGAYALTSQPRQAVEWLAQYASMGLAADPAGDPDFSSVKDAEGFAAVLAHMEENRRPVGHSEEAFRLAEPTYIPEGIAYDPTTGAFFVGSVHLRQIVRVDRNGQSATFATAERDGLWSVLGMAVDAGRRRLWVGSAAIAQTKELPEDERGQSGLWLFDLDSGALLRRFLLPPDGQPHVLGDVTVDANGDVYATDAETGGLYVLRDGGTELEAFLDPGTLVSPQGVCFFGEPRQLIVADYSLGLLVIDPDTRQVEVLPPPEHTTLLGIDGLACYHDRVIAVQNGVQPHRVIQFYLNETAERVEREEMLEASNPVFDEPTLGVIVGDTYYYVANSQWNKFDREGRLPDAVSLRGPVILKTVIPHIP